MPTLDDGGLHVGSSVHHYELLRKLGEGGMGTVYLARDTTLGRLVAIKVLRLQSGAATERFLIEAQATARCRHDNIVVIHEIDELDGALYMVLEYLEGRTLREWIDQRDRSAAPEREARRGPVPPALAIELLLPVVRALACAHELGVIHRDLKPENIFLTGTGRVVVLDFGIAKRLGARDLSALDPSARPLGPGTRLTQDGALLGTLPYMSPEQLRAEDVDARSDLWTVGVLLYELVAGVHPLADYSVLELVDFGESPRAMPSIRDLRPEIGALGTIIDRCLRKPRDQRYRSAAELLTALEACASDRTPDPLGEDESPFPGLSAFQEADAERYVGREREIVSVTGRLRHQPLVVVAGPSGAGKSSFVRAGVIPALKRSGERWQAFILRPGRRPLAQLVDLLSLVTTTDTQTRDASDDSVSEARVAELRAQPGLVGARLRAHCGRDQGPGRILLYVDQFEELYTQGADRAERAAFVACLEGVADDASSPLRVMLSLRSEYVYRMAEEGHFLAETARGLVFLLPMAREGLRDALLRPVEAAGFHFESEAMIDAMLEGLDHTKSPLPLLQFTAQRLWEARDRTQRCLTEASYRASGGVAGALSAYANAVLSSFSLADQRLCRAVFLQLCTPDRTRAAIRLTDLQLDADGSAVEQVVRRLSDARLVVIEAGDDRQGAMVELTHESLIDSWDKLQQWLAEDHHDAQFIARLSAAARQWETSHAPQGLLWRERAAHEAADWLARRRAEQGPDQPLGLGAREERFLLAVVALARRRQLRRWRIFTGVLISAAIVATVMALLSRSAKQQAADAQLEARQARNATRMATARELEHKDPTAMLALLREVEPPGVPRGWAVLASKALQSGIAREVRAWDEEVYMAAWSADGQRAVAALHDGTARVWKPGDVAAPLVLRGPDTPVHMAAFSPDGARIVTASKDRMVRVWNADGRGAPLVLRGHERQLWSASFSPDGKRIVSASSDRTARVWNADGSGEAIVLRGHEATVHAATFSPDGARVVTASFDKTARVWNADGSGEVIVLRGHDDALMSASFSPDGTHIVTASEDKTVRIWRADGTGEPVVLRGHESAVYGAVFSRDGQRILTASTDKTARIWSIDRHEPPVVLRGHEHFVSSAAWSADERSIVTSSSDRTTRVFRMDLLQASAPALLRGHELSTQAIAFSPDRQRVVTGSRDKTARVWRPDGEGDPVILRGHDDNVHLVSFSPDNQHVLTASADRTVRVWRADGAGLPVILHTHDGSVESAGFSPDGQSVITASDDKTVRISRADGTGARVVLRGFDAAPWWAGFSPDGKHIATVAADQTVRVWPADGSGMPVVYRGYPAEIRTCDWSPDGKRLLIAGLDHTLHVWAPGRSEPPRVFRGHDEPVLWTAWSADGKRIASASEDMTARVWNIDEPGDPLILRGHTGGLVFVAFGADNTRIITASLDETVRVWNADGSGEPYVLSPGDGNSITFAELAPDGAHIATYATDNVARIWPLHAPLTGIDDPRIWAATPYCLSVERRVALLSVSERRARAEQAVCEQRVKTFRAGIPAPPDPLGITR